VAPSSVPWPRDSSLLPWTGVWTANSLVDCWGTRRIDCGAVACRAAVARTASFLKLQRLVGRHLRFQHGRIDRRARVRQGDGMIGGNGEQLPAWQLPPGHSASVAHRGGSGAIGEHDPTRQLPPGHWLSTAHVGGSGGRGEHDPSRQLPPGQSVSQAHRCRACDASSDHRAS
jgi:hypothetical protein